MYSMNFSGMFTFLCLFLLLCFASCKSDNNTENVQVESSPISDSLSLPLNINKEVFKKNLSTKDMNISITSKGANDLKHLELAVKKNASDKSYSKAIQYDGTILDAVTADLNSDGKDEVYVFNQSAGSGSYGMLIAYQYNGSKLDSISMDELSEELSQKYLGHDSFAIEKKHLYRFFPLYNEMDPNCCPTGGRMKLKYDLVKKPTGLKLILNSFINEQ